MRKVTQNIVGVISLGVLAASWSIGQATESGFTLGTAMPSQIPEPNASDLPTTTPSSSSSPASKPTKSQAPEPTKSAASATGATVSKTSAPISYVANKGQGTMQISVTKTGAKITDVAILSGGTEGGDWAGVPSILAQAAIDAQGANFGNIGGATHTTDAFKTALESALAKF